MTFHRAGVILDEEAAARVMAPIAARENRACRETWGQISWRGVNRLGEREERIRKALAILKKRPTSSASLSKQLGVERHTVADYLRPFVVAGEIERVKYGRKSVYRVVK
jgi:predicted AAA+ superfamily ATPase